MIVFHSGKHILNFRIKYNCFVLRNKTKKKLNHFINLSNNIIIWNLSIFHHTVSLIFILSCFILTTVHRFYSLFLLIQISKIMFNIIGVMKLLCNVHVDIFARMQYIICFLIVFIVVFPINNLSNEKKLS